MRTRDRADLLERGNGSIGGVILSWYGCGTSYPARRPDGVGEAGPNPSPLTDSGFSLKGFTMNDVEAKFAKLDKRVHDLEKSKKLAVGALTVSAATVLSGIGGFVWMFIQMHTTVAVQEERMGVASGRLQKLEDRLQSITVQEERVSVATARLQKLEDRLQRWEDKDFKRGQVGEVVQAGVFVSLKAGKMTILVDGKADDFTVDPEMKIDFGGKQIALKDLPSKTPITFRTEEDGKRAVDIKVPPK